MTKQFIRAIWIALLAVSLTQCNNNQMASTVKLLPSDPFINTIVPSQMFDIDSKQDNIVEGENGTVIVCPKGCFINSKGNIVEGDVKIELAEALTMKDMLLSNLTTTSDGKPLETDGMIYFNATSNGEQLTISKDNPIHIEIPTHEKRPGMMAYKGLRDAQGNMNWIEPKELDKYLKTVDINTLDFLPEGFQTAVDKGMPYKNHKIASQGFTDSCYYNLAVTDGSVLVQGLVPTSYKEPYDIQGKNVVKENETAIFYMKSSSDTLAEDSPNPNSTCGIDPAIIKVIKSEKYQNTLIATKEFEARLKAIFKTCNNSVLEIYIQNLDKDLFELDSMAALAAGESRYSNDFINFSNQRLTKVEQADKYADLLKGFYENRLAKVKAELENQQAAILKELNKKSEQAQKIVDKYKRLLWKREKYRMETYGFNWTETGWVNIDNGTLPKSWAPKATEGIFVDNGKQFDRVYAYIIFTSIKSLYRLNTDDNLAFYAGDNKIKQMLMPKEGLAILVAVGYKGETPSFALKEFELSSPLEFNLTLLPTTLDKVKKAISPYEKYATENKIGNDLKFMAKLYTEEQRQKELQKESEFMLRLWHIAFPCCTQTENSYDGN